MFNANRARPLVRLVRLEPGLRRNDEGRTNVVKVRVVHCDSTASGSGVYQEAHEGPSWNGVEEVVVEENNYLCNEMRSGNPEGYSLDNHKMDDDSPPVLEPAYDLTETEYSWRNGQVEQPSEAMKTVSKRQDSLVKTDRIIHPTTSWDDGGVYYDDLDADPDLVDHVDVLEVDGEEHPPLIQMQGQFSENIQECRLCGLLVPFPIRRRHIRREHLRRVSFQCRHCPKYSTYHIGNVRKHMREVHHSKLDPIQGEVELPDIIDDMMYMCFMDKKILNRFEQSVVDTVLDLVEWAADGVRPEDLHPVQPLLQTRPEDLRVSLPREPWLCLEDDLPPDVIGDDDEDEGTQPLCSGTSIPDVDSISESVSVSDITSEVGGSSMQEVLHPPDDLSVQESNFTYSERSFPMNKRKRKSSATCKLCDLRNVSRMERHVLQHHVKKLVFLCPLCKFGSAYAAHVVKDHIANRHKRSDVAPVDVRAHFADEIRRLYDACFPLVDKFVDSIKLYAMQ